MVVISFQFSPDVGRTDQDYTLKRLKTVNGVSEVGRIDAESPDDDISRMCFVRVVDAAHVPLIADELHAASGVEGVSVEPRRGLV